MRKASCELAFFFLPKGLDARLSVSILVLAREAGSWFEVLEAGLEARS
jgi:hypothetical protein